MTALESMKRRVFLKYGIATAVGMAVSSKGINSENSCVPMQKRGLMRVIQKYGGEFGSLKFEKEA